MDQDSVAPVPQVEDVSSVCVCVRVVFVLVLHKTEIGKEMKLTL